MFRNSSKPLVLQNPVIPQCQQHFTLTVRFVLCFFTKKELKFTLQFLRPLNTPPQAKERNNNNNYSHCGMGRVYKTINNQGKDKIKPAGQETAMVLLKHASLACSQRLLSC